MSIFKYNKSIIPPDFQCSPQDMSSREYLPLVDSGCTCFCPVISPPGWEVVRTAACEPRHLDLFFLRSGSIILETEDKTLRATAGELMTVRSWENRHLYQDEDSDHLYLRFDNPEAYPQIIESGTRHCDAIRQILFCADMLCKNRKNQPDEKLLRSHLIQMLCILLQRELRSLQPDMSIIQMRRLEHILTANDRKDYNVDTIAQEFGMSFSSFRKFCMANYSMPPRAVVEKARMNRARGLLDYSLFSIDEIADRLGYADRFTFSKAFQRCCQITPAAFRKRYQ